MSLSLSLLVRALETIAPLELAESWDNVGLLVDPRPNGQDLEVERVLLAIDATARVLGDATLGANACLVAYHPPLFAAVKRAGARRTPALFEALRRGFAVYSPHTALDAAPGGLNDWLAQGLGEGQVSALTAHEHLDPHAELKLVVFVPEEHADALRSALASAGAGVIGDYTQCSFNLRGEGTFVGGESTNPTVGQAGRLETVPEIRLEMVCAKRCLLRVALAIERHHPYEEPAWEVYPLAAKPDARAGAGRFVTLAEPAPLGELVVRMKRHLGLAQLRLATSESHERGALIQRVAICAGAGGSMFESVHDADLFLTGEMRHHDVLAKLHEGASVILCEHSSSERGYLPRLAERLRQATSDRVEVFVAGADVEPIRNV